MYASKVADFGDADPEDAWDDGDPRHVKIGILVRLLGSVTIEHFDPRHNHDRVRARIAIGLWHTTRLREGEVEVERPILAALFLYFTFLNGLEG
jgi:hypothetical protein